MMNSLEIFKGNNYIDCSNTLLNLISSEINDSENYSLGLSGGNTPKFFYKLFAEKYKDYSNISDIILFDSKGYHKSESFDHNLLNEVPDEMNKMIAGNIQIDDIPNFKNKDFIIDLSGALEDQNGKKDIDKIDNLLNTVHNTNY